MLFELIGAQLSVGHARSTSFAFALVIALTKVRTGVQFEESEPGESWLEALVRGEHGVAGQVFQPQSRLRQPGH